MQIVWMAEVDLHNEGDSVVRISEFSTRADAEAYVEKYFPDPDLSYQAIPVFKVVEVQSTVEGMVVDENGNIAMTPERVEQVYRLTKRLRKQAKKVDKAFRAKKAKAEKEEASELPSLKEVYVRASQGEKVPVGKKLRDEQQART